MMRAVFPTKELRDEAEEKYHAIEGCEQTLRHLAAYAAVLTARRLPERYLLERDHPEGSGELMAGKVFFSVTMSLDGFMAPEAVPAEEACAPEKQDDRASGAG